MPELPPMRRDRLGSRLAELARLVRAAVTPEERARLGDELDRLAVGG